MIKQPPRPLPTLAAVIAELTSQPDQLLQYAPFYQSVDAKGRYLHFDELRHKVPKPLRPDVAWVMTKQARAVQCKPLLALGEPSWMARYMFTPSIQKAVSFTDRYTTKTALEQISQQIGEARQLEFLFNNLVQDEAISSSQLEGAATTTLVAKEMLQSRRTARTVDEKMIVGNFMLMNAAWQNRGLPLSLALILQFHKTGVAGINDKLYRPGLFRQTDDVVVVGRDAEVLHQPPKAEGLTQRLQLLCDWVNQDHEKADSADFLHPLVKAITLHFVIGFEHPFYDGNGRVARALFYWLMFKNDYAAFRYIAISQLLKQAPVQYGKSYLYSESDELDLTYFIDYQCSVILRAIDDYRAICQRCSADAAEFQQWLLQSGVYQQLNEKQKMVFQAARLGTIKFFTATSVAELLQCSFNTASALLNDLVHKDLFHKHKVGREWVYQLLEKQMIQQQWAGKV